MEKEIFIRILNSEMDLATGCTEPAAIALAAAYAGAQIRKLGCPVEAVRVEASVNMIKNAMAAGIPGTAYTGIDYAAAIGAVGGDPTYELQLIGKIPADELERAGELVRDQKVQIDVAKTAEKLYIYVCVTGGGHEAEAVIERLHTNLTLLKVDGKPVDLTGAKEETAAAVTAGKCGSFTDGKAVQNDSADTDKPMTPDEIAEFLTVERVFHYIEEELDPANDPIDIIRKSVEVNSNICDHGMVEEYGLKIGKSMEKECRQGYRTKDMATNAMMVTAAGADARMAGAPYSVVANSGSGNQGITATMPVVATARWMDESEDRMLRAVTLSNLIAIYIKSKFGRLSALCGATVAATGAACGITYLLGGGLNEISYAIQNMMGNVTGILCDGAKADCALKISTCVNAAVEAALMAKRGMRVSNLDGIVEEDVEKTICNFAEIGNKGSAVLDEMILTMMLKKEK